MLYRLDFCFAYIDDILVFSNNHNKHLEHLQIISRKLTDYDILINSGKSIFGVTSVTFLGYEISAEGTQLLPEHVAAFQEISLPKTVLIGPQRFLGILNFYRRLLPLAAKHQSSLNAAIANLRGPQPVPWTSNLKDSFAAVFLMLFFWFTHLWMLLLVSLLMPLRFWLEHTFNNLLITTGSLLFFF